MLKLLAEMNDDDDDDDGDGFWVWFFGSRIMRSMRYIV